MVSFVTGDGGRLVIEIPIKEEEEAKKKQNDGGYWNAMSLVDVETDPSSGRKVVKANFDLPKNVDPAKVKVTCKDRDLIVQVEDKVEKPDGISNFYYYRSTTLPENTDLGSIKCLFDADNNKLMVEAPYNEDLKKIEPRIIPVQMNDSSSSSQQQSIQNQSK